MTTHFTHCALRLGDNLAHLHFLRKMAREYDEECVFVHYAHLQYLPQLVEVVCDVPNITLQWIDGPEAVPGQWWTAAPKNAYSIDAWKNAGGKWENGALRYDYAAFMLVHFAELARKMGLASPLKQPRDLLFDYPAIKRSGDRHTPFDLLLVNSLPASGQVPGLRVPEMDRLAHLLALRLNIITTRRVEGVAGIPCTQGMSVTEIGGLSLKCKYIVAVSTGPSWPTFNVWNRDTVELRVLILGNGERVEIAPNTVHVATVAEAEKVLKERGLL